MTSFIAVYRGATVGDAKMVAVSGDPSLVAHVATALLAESTALCSVEADPVVSALNKGKRHALRLIRTESQGDER